jgi:hypothetical protein
LLEIRGRPASLGWRETGAPRIPDRLNVCKRTPRLPRRPSPLVIGAIGAIGDGHRVGGADRARTDDLRLARAALSQLSYSPRVDDRRARRPDRAGCPLKPRKARKPAGWWA